MIQNSSKQAPCLRSERQRRQEHVEDALANAALEGLQPTSETLTDMQDYIAGKITIEEGIHRLNSRYAIR